MAAAKIAKQLVVPSLPYFTKIGRGTIPIIFQKYEPKYFDEVHQLYMDAAEKGEGYTKEEVEKSLFKEKIAESTTTLLYLEEKTKEVLCVNIFSDSPVCRSTKTMLGSTAAVVHPKVRGKGVVRESYVLSYPVTIKHGYMGTASRVALTARNAIPTLAIGSQIYCSIPMCTPLEKFGIIDDLVICNDNRVKQLYPEHYQSVMALRDVPLPPLSLDENVFSKFVGAHQFPMEEFKTEEGMVRIRPVQNFDEALEAERLCRTSAEESVDFAIDEFDEDGLFNRQLLRSSDVVLAERAATGEVVGAAIIGPSKLTRTPVSLLAHQYITVKKGSHQESVSQALMQYSISNIKNLGYKGVLSDIYPSSNHQITLHRDYNFVFRGSLPYCGYMKDFGASPSLLVYLKL